MVKKTTFYDSILSFFNFNQKKKTKKTKMAKMAKKTGRKPSKKSVKKQIKGPKKGQKGGYNIVNASKDMVMSFVGLGKSIFKEVDSIYKLPHQLDTIPSVKSVKQPSPPQQIAMPSLDGIHG